MMGPARATLARRKLDPLSQQKQKKRAPPRRREASPAPLGSAMQARSLELQRMRARTAEARLSAAARGRRASAVRRAATAGGAALPRRPKWDFTLEPPEFAPDALRDRPPLPRPLCRQGPRLRPAPPPELPPPALPPPEPEEPDAPAAPEPDAPEPEEPAAPAPRLRTCERCNVEYEGEHVCQRSPFRLHRRPRTVSSMVASRSAATLARRAGSALPRSRSAPNFLRQCPRCMVLYQGDLHECGQ
jgi:hypothetical protein